MRTVGVPPGGVSAMIGGVNIASPNSNRRASDVVGNARFLEGDIIIGSTSEEALHHAGWCVSSARDQSAI
jgi:hypothetical protein